MSKVTWNLPIDEALWKRYRPLPLPASSRLVQWGWATPPGPERAPQPEKSEPRACSCYLQAASLGRSARTVPRTLRGEGRARTSAPETPFPRHPHPWLAQLPPGSLGAESGLRPGMSFLFGECPEAGEGRFRSQGTDTFPLETGVPVSSFLGSLVICPHSPASESTFKATRLSPNSK